MLYIESVLEKILPWRKQQNIYNFQRYICGFQHHDCSTSQCSLFLQLHCSLTSYLNPLIVSPMFFKSCTFCTHIKLCKMITMPLIHSVCSYWGSNDGHLAVFDARKHLNFTCCFEETPAQIHALSIHSLILNLTPKSEENTVWYQPLCLSLRNTRTQTERRVLEVFLSSKYVG